MSTPVPNWPSQPEQGGWQVPPTRWGTPPGFSPSPVPPPPGVRRRRRPPLWALIVGGVAVIGLVAGLLVWAPWSPPPQPPTAVRVSSPTATTVLVSWTAPKGGAQPSQYDILRDGKEQGTVPGTRTSWTDTGLEPGSRHSYTVITEGNGQKSAPTAKVAVTTITPPPADLTVTGKTYTTVTLHWSPPPNAPIPVAYSVYDTSTGKDLLDTLAGSQTSYTVTQLVAGDDYEFAVSATWDVAGSALAQIDAPPLNPPFSGWVPLSLEATQIPPGSTGLTVGEIWGENWDFTANCPLTTCTLTDKGDLFGNVDPFTMTLKPANGGYEGQATNVQFAHCDGANSYNTVTIQIYPGSRGTSNGAWTSWHGTMNIAYPGGTVGDYLCYAGDWGINLTNAGAIAAT